MSDILHRPGAWPKPRGIKPGKTRPLGSAPSWNGNRPGRRAGKSRAQRFKPQRYYGFIALAAFACLSALQNFSPALASLAPMSLTSRAEMIVRQFPLCGSTSRIDCVVDGDTFWLSGKKIRIADINTPETSSPQCAAEAKLGKAAKLRLRSLLNSGPFELRRGTRDEDRYGRKLRTVHRNGRSLGATLVAEGLAHAWNGRQESWCG